MTTEPADRDPSQDSVESRAEPEPSTPSRSADTDTGAEAALARQIQRWKGEGGSLHPDE